MWSLHQRFTFPYRPHQPQLMLFQSQRDQSLERIIHGRPTTNWCLLLMAFWRLSWFWLHTSDHLHQTYKYDKVKGHEPWCSQHLGYVHQTMAHGSGLVKTCSSQSDSIIDIEWWVDYNFSNHHALTTAHWLHHIHVLGIYPDSGRDIFLVVGMWSEDLPCPSFGSTH